MGRSNLRAMGSTFLLDKSALGSYLWSVEAGGATSRPTSDEIKRTEAKSQ
jgi:hypothetical protein